jgi:hypothetical protein
LVGIYELSEVGAFANLPAIKQFTLAFREYGSRYIKQLGSESGNAGPRPRARRRRRTRRDAGCARPQLGRHHVAEDPSGQGYLLIDRRRRPG